MGAFDDLVPARKQQAGAFADLIPSAPSGDQPGAATAFLGGLGQGVGNTALGAQYWLGRGLRAAGDAVSPPETTLSSLVTGQPKRGMIARAGDWLINDANAGRAKLASEVQQDWGGADHPTAAGAGKLGGEIVATLPIGGALSAPLKAAAGAGVAPRVLVPLADAVSTGGMRAGGVTGATGMAARIAGGAATGGASAALVDPDSGTTGAVIGGALPVALKGAGAVGQKIGSALRGPTQPADLAQAVAAARDAGYVIPPTQANPTLGNRLMEGFAGKSSTAQNASARNQGVTNKLAAEALGLAPDVKLTPELLQDVRKQAGQAYDAINSAGTVTPGQAYTDALDKIAAPALRAAEGFPNAKASPVIDLVESLRSPSFDASAAVAKIKELRTAADDAFRTGNTDVARASKAAAGALEDALDAHLQQIGNVDALQAFRDARTQIAKTYSVEKALNPTTGSVDARKLAAQLAKGKPLSGGLQDAANFALRFPKAAQAVEGMGSLPQTSPLDWAAGGGIAAGTSNPWMLAGVLARPAARKLTLADLVQNRLVQQPSGGRLADLLANPGVQSLTYRAAPVTLSDR